MMSSEMGERTHPRVFRPTPSSVGSVVRRSTYFNASGFVGRLGVRAGRPALHPRAGALPIANHTADQQHKQMCELKSTATN
jgi:hypothetical protein